MAGVPLIAMSLALVVCDSGDKIDTSKLRKDPSRQRTKAAGEQVGLRDEVENAPKNVSPIDSRGGLGSLPLRVFGP